MKKSAVSRARLKEYHLEVVEALAAIGNPTLGKAIQQDRGSQLEHLGIKFPDLRRRVRQGFSFYGLPKEQVLVVWDSLWRTSPYGDVLFAALEFYAPLVKKQADPDLWPVMREWVDRVDNWCHSDGLSAIYSWMLAGNPVDVYPQIVLWNQARENGSGARLLSVLSITRARTQFSCLWITSCRWLRTALTMTASTSRRRLAGSCGKWATSIAVRSTNI
jgi:hypothetical protein